MAKVCGTREEPLDRDMAKVTIMIRARVRVGTTFKVGVKVSLGPVQV